MRGRCQRVCIGATVLVQAHVGKSDASCCKHIAVQCNAALHKHAETSLFNSNHQTTFSVLPLLQRYLPALCVQYRYSPTNKISMARTPA